MKVTLSLTKEELTHAILNHIFTTQGWRLKPENVNITFYDCSTFSEVKVDEVEINIVKK